MVCFATWVFHVRVDIMVVALAAATILICTTEALAASATTQPAVTTSKTTAITTPVSDKKSPPPKGPHGGKLQPAGKYMIELVIDDNGYTIYVLNQEGKPLSVRGARAVTTILFKNGKKRMGTPNPSKGYISFTESILLRQEGDFTIGVGVKRGNEQLIAHFEHNWPPPKPTKKSAAPARKSTN